VYPPATSTVHILFHSESLSVIVSRALLESVFSPLSAVNSNVLELELDTLSTLASNLTGTIANVFGDVGVFITSAIAIHDVFPDIPVNFRDTNVCAAN
jgi:hypothetical protein